MGLGAASWLRQPLVWGISLRSSGVLALVLAMTSSAGPLENEAKESYMSLFHIQPATSIHLLLMCS